MAFKNYSKFIFILSFAIFSSSLFSMDFVKTISLEELTQLTEEEGIEILPNESLDCILLTISNELSYNIGSLKKDESGRFEVRFNSSELGLLNGYLSDTNKIWADTRISWKRELRNFVKVSTEPTINNSGEISAAAVKQTQDKVYAKSELNAAVQKDFNINRPIILQGQAVDLVKNNIAKVLPEPSNLNEKEIKEKEEQLSENEKQLEESKKLSTCFSNIQEQEKLNEKIFVAQDKSDKQEDLDQAESLPTASSSNIVPTNSDSLNNAQVNNNDLQLNQTSTSSIVNTNPIHKPKASRNNSYKNIFIGVVVFSSVVVIAYLGWKKYKDINDAYIDFIRNEFKTNFKIALEKYKHLLPQIIYLNIVNGSDDYNIFENAIKIINQKTSFFTKLKSLKIGQ